MAKKSYHNGMDDELCSCSDGHHQRNDGDGAQLDATQTNETKRLK